MKVLIGHDGSPSASGALALAAALPWPEDTTLWVARVAPAVDADELRAASMPLEGPGRTVEVLIRDGRPATVLAELAAECDADLLVLGSRGFSAIRSLVLGSVSSELIEHAPCSVLVARGAGHALLLVGTDGSPDATAMPRTLCAWELFRGMRALVLGVTSEDPRRDASDDRELALATRRLAARLETCGLQTRDTVAGGDPAQVILATAREESADLVGVAHRGRSPVAELLLGSVARKIVQHAHCSVLVVRSRTT